VIPVQQYTHNGHAKRQPQISMTRWLWFFR